MKMIKRMCLVASLVMLQACSSYPANSVGKSTASAPIPTPACVGSTDLPTNLASQFDAITDTALLKSALGEADQGKLCQGKVYQSKKEAKVTIYRAWNSTNPNSQYGQWWAFDKPAGNIANYRANYEICYQWSPLDKMVSCTLKPHSKVVVGNGQSAVCSNYLSYPVSESQQVYISDAANAVESCTEFDGVMSWQ